MHEGNFSQIWYFWKFKQQNSVWIWQCLFIISLQRCHHNVPFRIFYWRAQRMVKESGVPELSMFPTVDHGRAYAKSPLRKQCLLWEKWHQLSAWIMKGTDKLSVKRRRWFTGDTAEKHWTTWSLRFSRENQGTSKYTFWLFRVSNFIVCSQPLENVFNFKRISETYIDT